VFGQRANVIIANPNGVGCVGCSFINTGTVTLSTGVPRPDYNTGNVLFDVTRGTVSVAGLCIWTRPMPSGTSRAAVSSAPFTCS
jgi:haemagglutination activity domain